jgi:hypothetical protein
MADLVSVNRIASLLDAITSDDDLKAVVREVHRREAKLKTLRAGGLKRGDRVACRTKGRTIQGLVEHVQGPNLIIKTDNESVFRIPLRDVTLLSRDEKRLSA